MEKHKQEIKKIELFIHTFLKFDEFRNVTNLKYISHSNPNTPFSNSKSLKTTISLNTQLFILLKVENEK
jgi:hypothetical protein